MHANTQLPRLLSRGEQPASPATITVTPALLSRAKRTLLLNLNLKSAHLSEALAAGLGFNTHAALLAAFKEAASAAATLSPTRFHERLSELGHATSREHAEVALAHALELHALPYGERPRSVPTALAHEILAAQVRCVFNHPWAIPTLLDMPDVPDPSVRSLRLDRDVLRWNPGFVRGQTWHDLPHLLLSACLHRRLGHPERQGKRSPRTWGNACEMAVNHALHELKLTDRPAEGLRLDGRQGPLDAEEAHALNAKEKRLHRGRHPMIAFGEPGGHVREWPRLARDAIAEDRDAAERQAWPSPPAARLERMLAKATGVDKDAAGAVLAGSSPAAAGLSGNDAMLVCRHVARRIAALDDPGTRADAFGEMVAFAHDSFGMLTALAVAKHGMSGLGLRWRDGNPRTDRFMEAARSYIFG